MPCSFDVACDDMFALINAAWPNANALVGDADPLELRFPGQENVDLPPSDKYWGRVSVQSVGPGGKSTLGGAGDGTGLYQGNGLLFVQCFGPLSGDPQVWARLNSIAALALNSFRGKSTANGVWFRNEDIKPLQPDQKFQRINAYGEYEFVEAR